MSNEFPNRFSPSAPSAKSAGNSLAQAGLAAVFNNHQLTTCRRQAVLQKALTDQLGRAFTLKE
jgi:hypothetical protein